LHVRILGIALALIIINNSTLLFYSPIDALFHKENVVFVIESVLEQLKPVFLAAAIPIIISILQLF